LPDRQFLDGRCPGGVEADNDGVLKIKLRGGIMKRRSQVLVAVTPVSFQRRADMIKITRPMRKKRIIARSRCLAGKVLSIVCETSPRIGFVRKESSQLNGL